MYKLRALNRSLFACVFGAFKLTKIRTKQNQNLNIFRILVFVFLLNEFSFLHTFPSSLWQVLTYGLCGFMFILHSFVFFLCKNKNSG